MRSLPGQCNSRDANIPLLCFSYRHLNVAAPAIFLALLNCGLRLVEGVVRGTDQRAGFDVLEAHGFA
jgi:hypothetical protein